MLHRSRLGYGLRVVIAGVVLSSVQYCRWSSLDLVNLEYSCAMVVLVMVVENFETDSVVMATD